VVSHNSQAPHAIMGMDRRKRFTMTLARMFHMFHVKRIVNPRRALAALLIMLGILFCGQAAQAQGTIPVALAQQVDVNGRPLIGALLYTYVAGTVSAPLVSFQDSALTIQNPWPLQADTTGRIPMFYLPAGSVHVRLTTSGGVVVFDYPAMLVIGGTTTGGTVTPGVDPSTIASTGDVKWRPAGAAPLTGWVVANGTTIGDALSGSSQRANADTQGLFVWVYTNCPNAHCPTSGSRTGNPLTDYNAHFQIAVPDMRGRGPFGLDDMGATASGRILAGNMTGSGDTPTTPNGVAGINNNIISQANLPNSPLSLTTTVTDSRTWGAQGSGVGGSTFAGLSGSTGVNVPVSVTGGSITAATSGTLSGGGQGFSTIPNVLLGTWYLKL
jgi:hypothetical protein